MSMYSAQYNGKVLDFQFLPHLTLSAKEDRKSYTFSLVETKKIKYRVGIIFPSRRGWTAVSSYPQPKGLGLVDGFVSRHKAAEFLLQINDSELRRQTK